MTPTTPEAPLEVTQADRETLSALQRARIVYRGKPFARVEAQLTILARHRLASASNSALAEADELRDARLEAYQQGSLSAVEDMQTATHKDTMNEGAVQWADYCEEKEATHD